MTAAQSFRFVVRASAFVVFALLAGAGPAPIAAQGPLRALANPTELKADRRGPGGSEIWLSLDVRYGDYDIFNPATGQSDKVHIRSYNGQLVGPTIRMKPGETLRLRLDNKLPVLPGCPPAESGVNTPNCFNTTNLHTHGLHVSPTGNSDNVLLEIPPQTGMEFEINVPRDHPAGTFWYHTHRHGSTAIQVSSGMVGALIIEGDRPATGAAGGGADIDTILRLPGGRVMDERVMLFQQIPYACLDDKGGIITNGDGTWSCPAGKIGQIEQYGPQFGTRAWPASGRYTMINGLVQPTLLARAGVPQRWRMIHGGVRDTIEVQVTKSKLQLPASTELAALQSAVPRLAAADLPTWTDQNCLEAQTVQQFEIATDGLTRPTVQSKDSDVLQPGYRSDVLMVFPEPGVYCVVDDDAPATGVVNPEERTVKDRRLLALVEVRGGTPVTGNLQTYLLGQIVQANSALPAAVRTAVQAGNLTAFVPHQPLPASAVTGKQDLLFTIDSQPPPTRLGVNHEPYKPSRMDRTLVLGEVDEWTLSSAAGNHPFHIHVNPFEIVNIINPAGQSIIDATGKCTEAESDRQYCDMIGSFRDTMFVRANYKVIVRSKYERYIGDFVLHCHILDHEDSGMMQNVRIVPFKGATTHGGHGGQ